MPSVTLDLRSSITDRLWWHAGKLGEAAAGRLCEYLWQRWDRRNDLAWFDRPGECGRGEEELGLPRFRLRH
jgi:hypothetical protein